MDNSRDDRSRDCVLAANQELRMTIPFRWMWFLDKLLKAEFNDKIILVASPIASNCISWATWNLDSCAMDGVAVYQD